MLTLDLKKSNDSLVVHGKLITYLSTNIRSPMANNAKSPAASPTFATTNNSSSQSLNANASSTMTMPTPSLSSTIVDDVPRAQVVPSHRPTPDRPALRILVSLQPTSQPPPAAANTDIYPDVCCGRIRLQFIDAQF